MILWFLRFFNTFRVMEGAFRALEAQQDSAAEAITEAARLRELAAEATQEIEDLTNQLRSTEADLFAARAGGDDLAKRVARLKVKLRASNTDRDQLWELVHTAQEGERYALHTQVNHAVQRSGGGIPYADASALPADRVIPLQKPGPIGRRGRILPSERMARQEKKNVEAWAEAMAASHMEPES